MFTVRGENVYPSEIEVLRTFAELGKEFEIVVSRRKHMDEIEVRVEIASGKSSDDLAQRVAAELKGRPAFGPASVV